MAFVVATRVAVKVSGAMTCSSNLAKVTLIRRMPRRRGSVYLVVLGLSTLVTILAIGAIGAGLAQRHGSESLNDAADARSYAAAAIDLGRLMISQDATWRTDKTSGPWISGMAIGAGSCSLGVTDPIDGILSNRPYDTVILSATGYKGRAIQMMQTTLAANPTPLDALAYPLFVPGMLHIMAAGTCIVPGGTVATNGTLQSEGLLMGNAQCFVTAGAGKTTGTANILFSGCAVPASTVEAMYVALGTVISPGSTLQKVVLGPGCNPYGTANADGVYVINANGDITIRNCRISGTLVVVDPGHNVTIDQTILIQPARADYPALIIDGNAVLNYTTNGTPLSEAALGVNFNPLGAPYGGATNATMTDSYPSMISGLIDVKGTLQFNGNGGLIHGAVICESTTNKDAARINSNEEIDYDPTLFTNPPQGYTKSINMVPQASTWIRVTN